MSVSVQPVVVGSRKVRAALDTLVDVDAKEWSRAEAVTVALEPTPTERQPSAYVRASWKDRPRGGVSQVQVRTLTNAKALALHLEWAAPRPRRRISDYDVYPDACAVLLPADGKTLEHDTMGSPEHPVEAWFWRAGTDDPFVSTATGVGTSHRVASHAVVARADWSEGRWRVVLARPLAADGAPLAPGAHVPVGFAVWSGVVSERAGLKSYSTQPYELVVGE